MVRRIAFAGAVLMLGLTACGTPSHGPMTEVKCSFTGKHESLFMVVHFGPGAATYSPRVPLAYFAVLPGYKAIMSQPDPSSAARVAETYGWSCSIATP
jgi:hypothetical protein